MAGTITSVTKAGGAAWLVTWSGTPPFNLILQGRRLLEDTADVSYLYDLWTDSEEPPPFEILDSVDIGNDIIATSMLHSPRAWLQWRGDVSVEYYHVNRYIDLSWKRVSGGIIPEDGRGYYEYISEVLEDGATVQFRVVAIDAEGYESMPLSHQVVVVCNPSPPMIDLTYDEGDGEWDVTARE